MRVSRWFLQRLLPLVAARAGLRLYPGWRVGTDEPKSGRLLRLRKRLWSDLKTPCVIRWLNGLGLHLYPGNEISRAIFLTGYYEPNEFCLLDRILRRGMTFVDVGANMGLFTLFAAKKVGKQGTVVAIEPSNRDFERLRDNVELNGLSNVRLFQVALSNCRTHAMLLVATEEKSGHNTLGAFGYESVVEQGRELVSVDRLDDIVRVEGMQRIDVIKLDVEGAELLALQGATETLMRFRPVLLLELSDRTLKHQGCSSKDVWQFLIQNGYKIYAFDNTTGMPVPAERRDYFDAENIIAVTELCEGGRLWCE